MQSHIAPPPPKFKRPLFRWQFLLGIFIAFSSLSITYWNRFQLWEEVRNYQIPEPERSQRKAFGNQMDALQQQGKYTEMRLAAAKWRKSHPADPNGYATDGFAAYYLGDLNGCTKSWQKAASMDSLISESASGWIDAVQEVKANWAGPIPPLVLLDSDLTLTEKLWHKKAAALLSAKKYAEIETISAQLLKSQTRKADDRWLASFFFDGLTAVPSEHKDEVHWKKLLDQVTDWNTATPNSDIARLALATCWINGAGLARGGGYASTITPEGSKLMDDRLAHAEQILRRDMAHGGKSPLFVWTFHTYSQLAGMEGAPYDAIMNRELRAFPTYSQAIFCKAMHLLPRWYGEPGDWEKYAAASADKVGGVQGDILYARIVWRLQRVFKFQNIWKESSASWPRTQRGFDAILKRYPTSLGAANTYLVLAIAAQDNTTARRILKNYVGGRVDREYWNDTSYFARSRMSVLRYP